MPRTPSYWPQSLALLAVATYWMTVPMLLWSNAASTSSSVLFTFTLANESDRPTWTGQVAQRALDCARECTASIPECGGIEFTSGGEGCQTFDKGDANSGVWYTYQGGPSCPVLQDFEEVRIKDHLYCLALFKQTPLNFSTALRHCQLAGGYLVRLDDRDMYLAFEQLRADQGISGLSDWIGASDENVEGQWTSVVDGQPIDDSVFNFTDNIASDADNRDCATIVGKMDAMEIYPRRCKQIRGFICQADVV